MFDVSWHCLTRLRADRRGNFAIEFALAMPILLLLLVGLVDLGRYSLQKSALLQGAREGAQYGILAPTDTTNIQTTAQSATGLTGVTAIASTFCECVSGVPIGCGASCSPGTPKRYVQVQMTRAFSSVLGPATMTFGGFGRWTPPTTMSAAITMIVP